MNQAAPAHPSFDLLRSQHIESLNIDVQQFEHRETGALHYHLAADNTENVFLVALRTVPGDSSGVAHILEHTALCGSEKFPVRDPFFLMLRRSLNTFMNAFTSSDWTAYPFASQNRTDFDNLLQVYLDAVFFSRLDPLDFAQEGHRLEFAEAGNTESELVFKGVVFNEMKGAMSAVTSTLWQSLSHHLFPTTTYHYNSGGEPSCIPDLSYQQLREFYATHYHPSNAIFMTYGDIPAATHQAVFQEQALQRFQRLRGRIEVPLEQRFDAPRRVRERYAFDDPGSTDNKTHIVMAWLLGESADLEQQLEAQLLASVLLENSASPLQQLLETTELGQAPSPLCGLEDSMREMVFACGIEGGEAESAEALEAQVLAVIGKVAENGVETDKMEAILHQLELHQREISGDSYPYGLQLILTALGCATHYADPISALDLDPVLDKLRERISDPGYIKRLARELLLDNPHRVTLVMTPDRALSSQQAEAERQRLATIRQNLTPRELEQIIADTRALAQRQALVDDDSILPRVGLEDVPADIPELAPQQSKAADFICTSYAQGTNGLVYQQLVSRLPALSEEQLLDLPYYTNILTEIGLGDSDYLSIQERQSATCGSINAFTSMRGGVADEQQIEANFVLSSKALLRNHQTQAQLMRDTMDGAHFVESNRVRELVSQQRARREQAVTGNGHGLAMAAACAGMSPVAALNHSLSGLEGIRQSRRLDKFLEEADQLNAFCTRLRVIHEEVAATPRQYLVIAEREHLAEINSTAHAVFSRRPRGQDADNFLPQPLREQRRELWLANTQVNFCAQAFATVPVGHADAPALTVLGGFLRNGHLHTAIREQGGAYGGGASQDSSIGAFRFFSYRDPRLLDTLGDFEQSLAWLLENRHEDAALEQAILGVIGSIDKPGSPAGEAKQHFHNALFGRTHEQRALFRQQILGVSLEDLRRVTEEYLHTDKASIAVISNSSTLAEISSEVQELGLDIQEL